MKFSQKGIRNSGGHVCVPYENLCDQTQVNARDTKKDIFCINKVLLKLCGGLDTALPY